MAAASTVDTKERLLDAAEGLFADQGFRATSVRAITRAAGANLAAVGYHFGSKEALIEAVIDRRLIPLNRARQAQLDAAIEAAAVAHHLPVVTDVLRAFIEPSLRFRAAEPASRSFIALIGRVIHEPEVHVRNYFFAHMRPLFEHLLTALGDALPHLPREVVTWRLHFCIGAFTHTLFLAATPTPMADCDADLDPERLLALLLPFLTAGMEAKA